MGLGPAGLSKAMAIPIQTVLLESVLPNDPNRDAWFRAFKHGTDIKDVQVFKIKHGVMIKVTDRAHGPIIRGLIPSSCNLDLNDDILHMEMYLHVTHRRFPWEAPPWIPGVGHLPAVNEGADLYCVTSEMILSQIQRGV